LISSLKEVIVDEINHEFKSDSGNLSFTGIVLFE